MWTTVVAASFALCPAMVQAQQPDAVAEYINAQLQWRLIPGLSLVVMKGGRVIRAEGYGLANRERADSVRSSTLFHLGSVGKQFTAAAILLLAQEGRVRIDDAVSSYIRSTPPSWRGITIRHLLTHTSGLGNYDDAVDLTREYTSDELVAFIASQPLEFRPGEKYRYSNSGYLLLGLVVEMASGERLGDFLAHRVFAPLGMQSTGIAGRQEWPLPTAARGYRRLDDGSLVAAQPVSRAFNSTGDGSVYSTGTDLAKWDRALYHDSLLSRASRTAMWTPVRLNDGTTRQYGFGWSIGSHRQHRIVEHGGSWQGYATHIVRYPEDSITVAVLTNLTGVGNAAGVMANRVARYYIPALRAEAWPRPQTVSVDSALLERYVGEYRLEDVRIRIWREGTRLMISGTGRGTSQLLPLSPTQFVIAADGARLRFGAGAGQKPDLYVQDGREQRAVRLR